MCSDTFSKVNMCKIDTNFYRPGGDSDTAWPTVKGTNTPNQIINLHQPETPHPFTWLCHYTCTVLGKT